jgi:hypothetical protein
VDAPQFFVFMSQHLPPMHMSPGPHMPIGSHAQPGIIPPIIPLVQELEVTLPAGGATVG